MDHQHKYQSPISDLDLLVTHRMLSQVVGTLENLFKFIAASSGTLDIPIDKDSKPDEVSL